jgi:hypothetical protein
MITYVNQLSVPEISCYRRETTEAGETVVTYAQRDPGCVFWRGIRIDRTSAERVERGTMLYPDPVEAAAVAASCGGSDGLAWTHREPIMAVEHKLAARAHQDG